MASFEGVLANIPGYGGYLAKDQLNRRNTLSDLQQVQSVQGLMAKMQEVEQQKAVRGILADASIPEDQKLTALMQSGPLGMQAAKQLADLQQVQAKGAKAKRDAEFWANEAPKYTTPAQEEIRSQALPGGMAGPALPGQGEVIREAKPAGTDLRGLTSAAARAGVVGPDTLLKIQNDDENRKAMIEDRRQARIDQFTREMEAIRLKAEEGRISRAEADKRQHELKMMIAALGAANRQAPAPSVTQIADPTDPSKTLVIDARVYRGGGVGSAGVIGAGPKMTEAGKLDAKAAKQSEGFAADIQSAEDLLMGVKRTADGQVVPTQKPTGSGVGRLLDVAGSAVGVTVPGSSEAAELKTVAGRLVSRVPRFEGPQSDKDVALYKEMAADVGNDQKTLPQRLAALRRMRDLYQGYETGQRGRLIQRRAGATGEFDSAQPPPGFKPL